MSRRDREDRDRDLGEIELRDLDRVREKVTLRVEPGHLILAVLAVVLLLVVVFLAGFWIGRGMRAAELERYALVPPAQASVTVPAAASGSGPAPAPGPHEIIAPTRPRPTHAAVLPVPPPPPPPVEIPARDGDGAVAADRAPWVAMPEPPREDPWPALAVTDEGCRSCTVADGACDPVVVPAPPEPAVAAASEEAALQPPGPAGSEEAALQPEPARPARKPEREPAAKAEPRKEPAGPVFAVQVRSYRDEEKAKEFVAELAGKGYKARVVRFAQGDGDAWYRVRVGRFRSSAVAGEFASKFNEREGAQAIPVEER